MLQHFLGMYMFLGNAYLIPPVLHDMFDWEELQPPHRERLRERLRVRLRERLVRLRRLRVRLRVRRRAIVYICTHFFYTAVCVP